MTTPAPGNGTTAKYEPPQNEQKYYYELFALADQAKCGEINGHMAVNFLSRSKLPVDLLKNIWNMADHPKTNSLNKSKFFTAVRLIQLFQNGKQASGLGLMSDGNIRPPFFDGVTGVSIMPFEASLDISSPNQSPRMESQNTATSQGFIASPPAYVAPTQAPAPGPSVAPGIATATALTQDPYIMLLSEQVRYESLFPQYAQQDFVYGAKAVELFTKSGLSKEALRDIWNLVDDPVDNRLDRLEFAMAMHLIVCISKKNLPLPPVLPPSLKAIKDKLSAATATSNGTADGQVPSPPRQGQVPVAPMHRQNSSQGPPLALQHTMSSDAYHSPAIQHTSSGGDAYAPAIQQTISVGNAYAPSGIPIALEGANRLTSSISDAFEGMQGQGAHVQSAPSLSSDGMAGSSLSPPALNPPAGSSSSSLAELEKVRSILQKLQAENISLKAQLGQYSGEENSVKDEIAKAIGEIGTLSQDLTSLRSQVVDAKSNLIEASAELKAQLEKRDLLKALIIETYAMKEALDIGAHTIHTAEASVRGVHTRGTSHVDVDPPTVNNPMVNPFGDAVSVLTEHHNQHYVGHSVQEEPPASYHDQSAPSASMHQVEPQQYQPQQHQPQQHLPQQQQPQQQQPHQSEPPDQALQMLANLKDAAEQAEKDAQSANDHTQALSLQVEDIRREFELLNDNASKMQSSKPKKKGFLKGKGGKKEHQKEVEAAINLAEQKSIEVQQAHDNLGMAQRNANNMKEEASQKRAEADSYEIQLADYLIHAQHPQEQEAVPATMSKEDFGAAARGQEYVDAPPTYQSQYDHSYGSYGESNVSYDNSASQNKSGMAPMGFGGYPSTTAGPAESGTSLMGGNSDTGLMGGNYSRNPVDGYYNSNDPGRSVQAVDAPTQNVDQHLMGGAPTYNESYLASNSTNSTTNIVHTNFPGDASVTGMSYASDINSYAGISYDSAPVTNLSHAGGSFVSVQGEIEPADASITGMSNAGSYLSAQEPTLKLDNIVAPLPAEYNIPAPGYDTDLSIQGSVSRTGTISGYNSVNPNAEYATDSSVQGSSSNAGTISGYNSDVLPAVTFTDIGNATSNVFSAKPQVSQNVISERFGGIPSPIKEDNFVPNVGLPSFGESFDYTASGDQNANESKSFDSGIPTPTASNDDSFYGFASHDQPAPTYPSQPVVASLEQNNNAETFINDSVHETTELMANTKVGSAGSSGSQSATHFAPNNVETLMPFGIHPTSSLDDGIPTPTAPNDDYANVFG